MESEDFFWPGMARSLIRSQGDNGTVCLADEGVIAIPELSRLGKVLQEYSVRFKPEFVCDENKCRIGFLVIEQVVMDPHLLKQAKLCPQHIADETAVDVVLVPA